MFRVSATELQSTATSMFSAYASLAAFMMMFRSLANELVREPIRSYLQSFLHYLFSPLSTSATIVIEDEWGISRNDVYDAADAYLRTKISPTTERFKVGKTSKQKTININFEKNQEIPDTFEDIQLKWKFISEESEDNDHEEKSFFELKFNKKYRERVLESYLPYVLTKAKEIEDSHKVVKLYGTEGGGSVNLDHPSSFETLAMEPEIKKALIDDLERFVRRRDYYKKVGKPWKRGYLLYGPPGTGKSSLIAAMANYLKFDIYDLQLSNTQSNSTLRRILLSTTNRSIIVMEDIDCSLEMQDRRKEDVQGPEFKAKPNNSKQLTLSGLLNFIDGLWSSCGDERIIVFTTNHKEKLDPALLRPGRMDLHIHMSYCTYQGFRLLASNYLDITDHKNHRLFGEIEELMKNAQVTPAELAEELMKSEDVDIALGGIVKFLKCKKIKVLDKDDCSS